MDLEGLQACLEYRFSPEGRTLAKQAVTHRSYQAEASYERLEFLGDRVLGLVVARLLWQHFPEESEGDMARRHAGLVRKASLVNVADSLGLGRFLRLSASEEEQKGRQNNSILADVVEAIIAALYLDGGIEIASAFICKHWQPLLQSQAKPPQDNKSALQEWTQGKGLGLPQYTITSAKGAAHAPEFIVEVKVLGYSSCSAKGRSKRDAQQAAASLMLEKVMGR